MKKRNSLLTLLLAACVSVNVLWGNDNQAEVKQEDVRSRPWSAFMPGEWIKDSTILNRLRYNTVFKDRNYELLMYNVLVDAGVFKSFSDTCFLFANRLSFVDNGETLELPPVIRRTDYEGLIEVTGQDFDEIDRIRYYDMYNSTGDYEGRYALSDERKEALKARNKKYDRYYFIGKVNIFDKFTSILFLNYGMLGEEGLFLLNFRDDRILSHIRLSSLYESVEDISYVLDENKNIYVKESPNFMQDEANRLLIFYDIFQIGEDGFVRYLTKPEEMNK